MMAALGAAITKAAAIGDLEEVVADTMVVEEAAEEEVPMVATVEDEGVIAEEVPIVEAMITATATEAEVAGMTAVTSKREIGSSSHQEECVVAYRASLPVCQAVSHTATTRLLRAKNSAQHKRHLRALSLLAT
jgi:hypothetical protein